MPLKTKSSNVKSIEESFKIFNIYPKKSLFGFKLINSFHSILVAYLFILIIYLITPFFGTDKPQLIAAIFFHLIINISIIILTVNSIFKFKRYKTFYLIFLVPLAINIPISISKIFNCFISIKEIFF